MTHVLPLTRRQREVLDFLVDFTKRKGYAPSLAEIGLQFGLTSLATVHKHLMNLQDKGYVRRRWNCSRAIDIVFDGGTCPLCGSVVVEKRA